MAGKTLKNSSAPSSTVEHSPFKRRVVGSIPSGRTMANAEYKFMLQLGAIIRGTIISQLKNWCFQRGLKITIDEDKGWFDSTYRITVEVEESAVLDFKDAVNEYVSRLEDK